MSEKPSVDVYPPISRQDPSSSAESDLTPTVDAANDSEESESRPTFPQPQINDRDLDELVDSLEPREIGLKAFPTSSPTTAEALPTAQDIKAFLDTRVIGQDQAKLLLSVLFSMHIHRQPAESSSQRPPNAIIVGPTGVGKTHTIRVASEFLRVPFLTVDSTTLVPSGARGVQIGNVVEDLLALAEALIRKHEDIRERYPSPLALAERGVVFFDEFDKIADKSGTTGGGSLDKWNLGVQRALLKFCEGSLIGIGVRDSSDEEGLVPGSKGTIDTSGILVLAGGAFQGINESKIKSRRPEALQREIRQNTSIISSDFAAFGIMPELVARLQVLVEFRGLSTEDLQKILENKHTSPTEVWIKHFREFKKDIQFSSEAIRLLASRASLLELGARGLHQILFPSLAGMTYATETSDERQIIVDAELLKTWISRIGY